MRTSASNTGSDVFLSPTNKKNQLGSFFVSATSSLSLSLSLSIYLEHTINTCHLLQMEMICGRIFFEVVPPGIVSGVVDTSYDT